MSRFHVQPGHFPGHYFDTTVDYIRSVQQPSGAIPWFEGGHTDPWNHIEAAMGLSIGGRRSEAELAYQWLANEQLDSGAWWARYENGQPHEDPHMETNYVAYIATGVWHHYQIYQDPAFLRDFWPVVVKAMDFIARMQAPTGEIYWAMNMVKGLGDDALVTGSSSIYKSLECAIHIAEALNEPADQWRTMRARLGEAIRTRPERFDRSWESKARFSMDWFYPVMTGVLKPSEARMRLHQRWDEFVEPGLGCRCVSDRPWVTVAESCELTMALLAAGRHRQAVELFNWLHRMRNEDGSWWTGYVFDNPEIWPLERTTWTAGATLLAADAIAQHTAGHRLFLCHRR